MEIITKQNLYKIEEKIEQFDKKFQKDIADDKGYLENKLNEKQD